MRKIIFFSTVGVYNAFNNKTVLYKDLENKTYKECFDLIGEHFLYNHFVILKKYVTLKKTPLSQRHPNKAVANREDLMSIRQQLIKSGIIGVSRAER